MCLGIANLEPFYHDFWRVGLCFEVCMSDLDVEAMMIRI